jgi:hypothetical protein
MEAIYLVCDARRPQLKRDPLGCGPALTFITMGTGLFAGFKNQGQGARTQFMLVRMSCGHPAVQPCPPSGEGSMQVSQRDARPGPA